MARSAKTVATLASLALLACSIFAVSWVGLALLGYWGRQSISTFASPSPALLRHRHHSHWWTPSWFFRRPRNEA